MSDNALACDSADQMSSFDEKRSELKNDMDFYLIGIVFTAPASFKVITNLH
jgi:hypothetical protein